MSVTYEVENGWHESLLKEAAHRLRHNLFENKTPSAVVQRFGLRQMIDALLKAPDQKADATALLVAISPTIFHHPVSPREKLMILDRFETVLEKTRMLSKRRSQLNSRQLQTQ